MTSESPVVPPSGEPSPSKPHIPKKVAVRLALIGLAIAVGVGLLVAQTSKSSNAPPAKWVVVPQSPPRGPGGAVPPASSNAPVTLGANIVTIPVPEGWTAAVSDDQTNVDLAGDGLTAYVEVVPNNTQTASTLVNGLPAAWLNPDDTLSNVKTYQSTTAAGGGIITGQAQMIYTADEKTDSGSRSDIGNLFADTRNDGWAMEIQLVAQGSDVTDATTTLKSTVASTWLAGTYNSFAHQ